MKRIITAILLFHANCLSAQNDGIYFSQSLGAGMGNISFSSPTGKLADKGNLLSEAFEIKTGYWRNNKIISIGLGYLRSGFVRKNYIVLYPAPDYTAAIADERSVFSHIIVPVSFSYIIPLNERLSLIPVAGFDIAYNMGERLKYVTDKVVYNRIIDDIEFRNTYNSFSVFAAAKFHVAYRAKNTRLFAGPSLKYMLGNVIKSPVLKQHNYTLMMDAGISWHFKRKNIYVKE